VDERSTRLGSIVFRLEMGMDNVVFAYIVAGVSWWRGGKGACLILAASDVLCWIYPQGMHGKAFGTEGPALDLCHAGQSNCQSIDSFLPRSVMTQKSH
jgi:hypothetical protein